ncbi:MAG: hypothetical protein KJ896_02035, partial [Nanoarchaeota archaeon]|nr:hypothetical protein [Nanoarchaeota archaeon]
MKLNLYQLCDNDLSVGSIRVILNENLKNQINHTINQLKQTIKLKDLSKKFGVDYTTLWSYCNRRNYIPLIVLKRLEELSNTKFSQEEFNVICGQAKTEVRLPIKINVNLAKIIGAIIADGHIGIRKSGRGQHYELVIREEYLSNVLAFSKWFKEEFGIYIKPKKENNHYYF